MDDYRIEITPLAAEQLAEIRAQNNLDDNLPLRVDIVGGASSGFAYDLFFDSVEATDIICESQKVRILLRPDTLAYLSGTVIDWIEGANGAGFVLHNPNEPPK